MKSHRNELEECLQALPIDEIIRLRNLVRDFGLDAIVSFVQRNCTTVAWTTKAQDVKTILELIKAKKETEAAIMAALARKD